MTNLRSTFVLRVRVLDGSSRNQLKVTINALFIHRL